MSSHPTRERILDTAMTLFAAKGYLSTSVADILQTADVRSGSLYHHFATKQDLLAAVLERYRDGIDTMLIEPAWQGVDDPIDRVFALLAVYRDLLRISGCTYGCPIGSLALELHEPDPPVRKLLADNFDAWKARVTECLRRERRRLPKGTTPESLATLVLAVMEGAVMQSRTYRDLDTFDTAVQTLRTLFHAT